MAGSVSPPGRGRYNPTRHRGLSYRLGTAGRRRYYGYIPGRGRVPLDSSGERDALAEYGELRGKAARGERVGPSNVRLHEVAEEWFESKRRLRESTRRAYRDALNLVVLPRFGHRRVSEIDASAIAKLIRDLETEGLHAIDPKRRKRPLAASTISNHLKPLAGTLGFAHRRGLIGSNPCRALTPDDRPDPSTRKRKAHEWSDDEIEALLTAARVVAAKPEARQDYSALLETAVYTGLRLGELLGLRWQDVDLDERVLHIEHQFTQQGTLTPPKTEKGKRRVPLSSGMVTLLRRQKTQAFEHGRARPQDFVFASQSGQPLDRRNIARRGFQPARDLAKLSKDITFHDLRHAFASYAAHRGVPIQVLSEVMGHANVAITQTIYTHLYNREAAEKAFRDAMSS